MNKKALECVKIDLYKSSNIVKTRLDLIEKYKTGLEDITNRILGEKGKNIIEKYSEYVKRETHLVIPGRVDRICSCTSQIIYLYAYDTIDISIPRILPDINSIWWGRDVEELVSNFTETEKSWYIEIKSELEKNSELVNSLWKEISDVFYNISEKQLKSFPEAYNLYLKYRS